MAHIWHRRQQLLLPLGKNYCSIEARSRNSFTARTELDPIETKSTSLTSRLQRCDTQTARDTTFPASSVEILVLRKGGGRNSFTFKIKLEKIETTRYEFNVEFTNMWPTYGTGDNSCCFLWGKTIAP